MNEVLQVKSLTKRVKQKVILQDVSLSVSEGEILGLIGPNGAGKTTLLKIVSGVVRATSGSVLFDKSAGIGVVPEQAALLGDMNALQNLRMLSSIRGKIGTSEIKQTLRRVGLDPDNKTAVRNYSLGMKQRLMLAQAIMERPKLLLLDEPTNALDPLGIIDLRMLLSELAQAGTGIIIASHLLNEIERMCDRVAIINGGKILRQVNLRSTEQTSIEVSVSTADDWGTLKRWAESAHIELEKLTPNKGLPRGILNTKMAVPQVIAELQSAGVAIESISHVGPNLEAVFLECAQLEGGMYR